MVVRAVQAALFDDIVGATSAQEVAVQELVLYVDIEGGGADEAELKRVLSELEDVAAVNIEREEVERGGLVAEMINSYTVHITAAGGAVAASSLFLGQVRALLASVDGVREAWVKTKAGPKPIAEAAADQGPK